MELLFVFIVNILNDTWDSTLFLPPAEWTCETQIHIVCMNLSDRKDPSTIFTLVVTHIIATSLVDWLLRDPLVQQIGYKTNPFT